MFRQAALGVLLVSPAALADGITFGAEVQLALPPGTGAGRILAGDLTGDGLLDVLAAPEGPATVVARVGLGGLAFGPVVTSTPTAEVGFDWELGDMDGDGLPDLVAGLPTSATALQVLLSAGDGSFVPAGTVSFLIGGSAAVGSLALLDADLDGALDACVGKGDALGTAFGDGAGGLFVPHPPLMKPGMSGGSELDRVDLNADGHADLVSVGDALPTSYGWTTLLNDGDGLFGATSFVSSAFDVDLFASDVGDLDGNSWPDLLVAAWDFTVFFPSPTLQPVLGNGLTMTTDYPGDTLVDADVFRSLQLGDLDGDGLDDVVGTPYDAPASSLLVRVNRDGVLEALPDVPLAQAVHDVQLADMDSDGRLDVLLMHLDDDGFSVLLNGSLLTGWNVLGGALPGSAGAPQLAGTGALQAGETVRLRLTHALPSAPVWLVIGAGLANLPFKGGALMPTPDAVFPGLVTDVSGFLTLASTWPAGVPSGFEAWMQEWIADPAGPKGFAASNAVVAKTGP